MRAAYCRADSDRRAPGHRDRRRAIFDQAKSPGKDSPARTAVVSAETKHLAVRATLSEHRGDAGRPDLARVDITPKPGMHVYAPGCEIHAGDASDSAAAVRRRPSDAVLSASRRLFLCATERACAGVQPARSGSCATSPSAKAASRRSPASLPSRITLKGTLDYQACDDKFCYLRTSVPLQWTVKIKR